MSGIIQNVDSKEILNFILILAVLIITACIAYATYYFVQALKSITNLADDLVDTTQSIKQKIQLKALAAIPALLVALIGKVIKRRR